MRLIDADALLEKLRKTDRYFMVKFDIDNAPTVELTASFMRQQAEDELIRIRAEADQRGYQRGYNWGLEIGQNLKRPTGEWKDLSDGWQEGTYECSNCKTEFVLTEGTPEDNEYHFCPNCGAKMKGGAEE